MCESYHVSPPILEHVTAIMVKTNNIMNLMNFCPQVLSPSDKM